MNGISAIRPVAPIPDEVTTARTETGDWSAALRDAMEGVQTLQSTARQGAARFMAGESEDLHQIAIDQQKAAIAFDLFLQVRNKVVQAYQEVMRMPL